METIAGQAKNWIYPKIGTTKLREFTATDADNFFKELGGALGKRSLVMIKSTLRRSIRRAQVHGLIGRNVVELIDLPTGQPGHPSRAMTQEQAATVLKAASGKGTGYARVVKVSKGRYGATHAATETGELACGTKPHPIAPITDVSREIKGNNVPLMPNPSRHRRHRERQPTARSSLRPVDHARPTPWRTAPAHVGPRRPQQGSGPRLALGEQER
jgi:hypothetical protein